MVPFQERFHSVHPFEQEELEWEELEWEELEWEELEELQNYHHMEQGVILSHRDV
jgi:hypothetical protein